MQDHPLDAVLGAGWRELCAFAERQSELQRDPATSALEPIGLFLEPLPSGPWSYESTPSNGVTFASTGGDGVHFSVLTGQAPGPVVMTVPMNFDRENLVVGADIRDFLRLGCRAGYFVLEQLTYRRNWALLHLEGGDMSDQEGDELLVALRRELGLDPPTRLGEHLDELQAQYFHLIEARGSA